MPGEKEVLKTTCPRDCYDACAFIPKYHCALLR